MKVCLSTLLLLQMSLWSFSQSVSVNTDGSSPDPSAILDVKSSVKGFLLPRMTTAQRTAISTPANGLQVFDTDTKTFWFYNGNAWTESATGSPVNYWTLNTNDIYTNNSGDVGIGISSPTAKLEIGAPSSKTNVELSITANGANNFSRLQFRNYTMGYSRIWWLAGKISSTSSNDDLLTIYNTAAGDIVGIKGTGDVGIGTDDPTAKLEIAKPSIATGVELSLTANGANNFSRLQFRNYTMGYSRIWWLAGKISSTSSNDDLLTIYNTAAGDIVGIKGTGDVGIGTDDPTAKLEIAKPSIASGVELSLTANGANNYSRLQFRNLTMDYTRVWWLSGKISSTNNNDDILTFYNTAVGDILSMRGNGNVGIGTSNPTYKLSVNGNVRSKEVVVESNWADYVLDENYDLPTLHEVKDYITRNRHLSGIPSAAEIKDSGLSLGDMQKRMMAKIEELTIYLIQANEKIERLTKAMELLKVKQ